MEHQTVSSSARKIAIKSSSNRILDQMEFYLSDSNLRRDQFLRHKIKNLVPRKVVSVDGKPNGDDFEIRRLGLELTIFLEFNNIKRLTNNESTLRLSLVESSVVDTFAVQSGEGMQWLVARKDWADRDDLEEFLTTLDGSSKKFEGKTIYCENLPINANQQWLRKVFSQFGRINLVSVPRFKGVGRIKQFCFIEFAEQSTIPTVLEFFRQFNGVLSYDESNSDNLQSIQKFHEENHGSAKQTKTNQPLTLVYDADVRVADEIATCEESASADLNDNMIYDLKIMAKLDWKRLRNKYLNLQREMFREMKNQLCLQRMGTGDARTNNQKDTLTAQPGSSRICPPLEHDEAEGMTSNPTKRRKRGRERVKLSIKKRTHIFFDA